MNLTDIKQEARAVCIAEQNDKFRKGAIFGFAPSNGMVVVTPGISELASEDRVVIFAGIQMFSDFSEEDDPYGEHDFGSVEFNGQKVFWKIDYYADASVTYGSEDPADPAKTYRVLTVMLASEY